MLFESGVGHANLSHVFSCHLMVSQTNAHHVSKKRSVRTSSFESGLIPSSDKDMVWPDPESFCLGVIGQLVIEALAHRRLCEVGLPAMSKQAMRHSQPQGSSGLIGLLEPPGLLEGISTNSLAVGPHSCRLLQTFKQTISFLGASKNILRQPTFILWFQELLVQLLVWTNDQSSS